MLTKEEVLDIIAYCDENGVKREDRLKELGISRWAYYASRRRYVKEEAEYAARPGVKPWNLPDPD
ncbi:MAG: hypothetical protein LIO91_01455 [Bacteroidales bacterium]|nr:hypothetical protein [Bacteroidales bacterium]